MTAKNRIYFELFYCDTDLLNLYYRSGKFGQPCHNNCKSFKADPSKFEKLEAVCNKLNTISSKTIRLHSLQKLYPLFQEKAYHLQTVIVVRKGIRNIQSPRAKISYSINESYKPVNLGPGLVFGAENFGQNYLCSDNSLARIKVFKNRSIVFKIRTIAYRQTF